MGKTGKSDETNSEAFLVGQKLSRALGRVSVAYLALSGARDLIKDPKLAEIAKLACRTTNVLECKLRKALEALKNEAP